MLRTIILIAGSLFAGVASSADWAKVYDGKSASIAIVSATSDPKGNILLIVEEDMNHLNYPTQDGKKTFRSTRWFWAVDCRSKQFKTYKWAAYDRDYGKGNIVEKQDEVIFMIDSFKSAESGSKDEYMIDKVCHMPEL